jgi:hypothetical protein
LIEQRTEEWRQARAGHVTASRADDVTATVKSGGWAAARQNYIAQLVLERLLKRPCEEAFVSRAMEIGTEREPSARSWYTDKTGLWVTQLGFTRHPSVEWVGASIDGEVEEGVGGIEIKCPQPSQHMKNLIDGPTKYFGQVQFQMWIMGWAWVDVVTYNPDFPTRLIGKIVRVKRNQIFLNTFAESVLLLLKEVQDNINKLESM